VVRSEILHGGALGYGSRVVDLLDSCLLVVSRGLEINVLLLQEQFVSFQRDNVSLRYSLEGRVPSLKAISELSLWRLRIVDRAWLGTCEVHLHGLDLYAGVDRRGLGHGRHVELLGMGSTTRSRVLELEIVLAHHCLCLMIHGSSGVHMW